MKINASRETYTYIRESENKSLLIILNFSRSRTFDTGIILKDLGKENISEVIDLLNQTKLPVNAGKLKIDLKPSGAAIIEF